MLVAARKLLKEVIEKGCTIFFADETVFTSKTLPKKTFAAKGKNMQVDMQELYQGYRSALCAISTDGKIEHLKVTEKAIDHKKFISWLRVLR